MGFESSGVSLMDRQARLSFLIHCCHHLGHGKESVIGFLVGQVMKRSGGSANPKLAQELLRERLAG